MATEKHGDEGMLVTEECRQKIVNKGCEKRHDNA